MPKLTINFTKSTLNDLPLPPAGTRVTYHDTKTHGLQLRVASSGVKTFSVFRWVSVDGKPERVTLGRFPDMSIEQAREKAANINAVIANKKNPNEAIRAQKAEMTFGELFAIYMERWSKPHKKTWRDDEDKFRLYIAKRFADKKLSRITRADIATLHTTIGKTHPITANRVLALISSVFGRAMEWGIWNQLNPAQGIRKFPEKSRDRFIQSEELPLFFESLSQEPNEMLQDYFMLLLLTGVRRSNLMAMRWDAISFERKEWRIPDTKNGDPQIVSLDDGHGVILRLLEHRKAKIEMYRAHAKANPADTYAATIAKAAIQWVFPSDSVTGHVVEPRKCWERIVARAKIYQLIHLIAEVKKWSADKIRKEKEAANASVMKSLVQYREKATTLGIESAAMDDLRIHDLRRTLGSWMAGTGATTVIIGRQLNQKSASATAIYARLQQNPVMEARNKAVSAMFGAGGILQPAEVVDLKPRNKSTHV